MENKQPLVSVNVLMYNSSKYILETLESIKAQTYQNIELIMSDDKSTDDTVKICEKWIAKNRDRFVSYQILVPDHNTGQSGNYNRAFRAATGEWIKEIDGDDLLLPNCITDLIKFASKNSEAKYIFGKMSSFTSDNPKCITGCPIDESFFKKDIPTQLEKLLFEGNCLQSPCSFYDRQYMLDINFQNDERIPNLEDWPKWINLLQKNVHFFFLNKEIVLYRLFSGISTQNRSSSLYFKNLALFRRYYQYPAWLEKGSDYALKRITEQEIQVHNELLKMDRFLERSRPTSSLASARGKKTSLFAKIWNFLHLPDTGIRKHISNVLNK